MDIEEYINLKNNLFKLSNDLSRKKGHDYSGEEDTLFNIKVSERLEITSAENGVLIRMGDKFARLIKFTKQNRLDVKDEKLVDTLLDFLNYLTLFYAVIVEKKNVRNKDS